VCNKSTGTIRKLVVNNGYYIIKIYKDKKYYIRRIHRLVAEHFIINDDPINKTTVNHIDGNKLNNHADNLEWASNLDNCYHAIVNNLSPDVKLNIEVAREIREIRKTYGKKITMKEIADKYNVSVTCVFRIIHNKSWKEDGIALY
jgi:hypothetical protein